MNILLFNQYAGNKGDRAVLYATCQMLKRIHPDANIIVSTSSPELYDGYSYYRDNNIEFIPTAWDYTRVKDCAFYWKMLNKVSKYTFTILREVYLRKCCYGITRLFINPLFRNAVRKADKIISVGGHHYCTLLSRDLVSDINFDAMAVRLQGKSFTCFSQTFGPFDFHNNPIKGSLSVCSFQLTLPYHNNIPPKLFQNLSFLFITGNVSFNFIFPEFFITFRPYKVFTTFMTMPKASVDEDASTILLQHNIGRTRQSLHIDTETEAMCEKEFPYNHLWLRILATDVCHASMPLFGS